MGYSINLYCDSCDIKIEGDMGILSVEDNMIRNQWRFVHSVGFNSSTKILCPSCYEEYLENKKEILASLISGDWSE